MKQALTAGGSLSVWFESAKLALYKMGVDYKENKAQKSINGTHPQYGEITIDFFVPEAGKTKMEISVQDAKMISDFKKIVIPAFKFLSAQKKEEKGIVADAATAPNAAQCRQEVRVGSGESQWVITPRNDTGNENLSAGDDDAKAGRHMPINPPVVNADVKTCKYCQAELKEGDKVCPKCGKKQSFGLLVLGIIVGAIVLIGLIVGVCYSLWGKKDSNVASTETNTQQGETQQSETSNSQKTEETVLVTLSQYQQVTNGMTYEQVCSVMGREGTFLEPETKITGSDGKEVTLRTYYWEAEGPQGANVCVTFQDGAVATISQYGLQ